MNKENSTSDKQYTCFWENRDRYKQSPNRYLEVSSKPSIQKLLSQLGKNWKKNHNLIKYADLGSGECKGTKLFANFLEKIIKTPIKAIGIDASTKCKLECEKQGIDFILLDLNKQSIPLDNIQVFTIFETIEHILNTDNLLASIRKSISSDGILLVSTLNVVGWKNRILVPLGVQPLNTEVSTKKLSYGFKFNFLKQKMETWKPAGHIRPFTLNSLCDILLDNGFSIIKCYGLENWKAFKFLEYLSKNMCTGILVIAKPT